MRVYKFAQRSEEWFRIRRGIPTSSQFERVIQPVKGGASTSQDGYIDELLCEQISQEYSSEPEDSYVSKSMANGTECEPIARAWYSFDRDAEVTEVGFCLSDCGRIGCSPDGLIGDDGLLEIKCPDLKQHVRYKRDGVLPNKYKPQVHGSLLVTGRKWSDFVSYSPCAEEIDHLVVRVTPNEFTKQLAEELERFLSKYHAALKSLGRTFKRPVDIFEPDTVI